MSCESKNNEKTKHDNSIEHNESNSFNNPQVSELEKVNENLELLRGDAIGDTMYSERFVLKTILQLGKLTRDLEEEAEIEKDLCTLWDMTMERDVIKYLLENDVLELFGEIMKNTNDKRLMEILVGILANMCNLEEVRLKLCVENLQLVTVLLDLSAFLDALTLQQLMRLWSVIFTKCPPDYIEMWYKKISEYANFIENICFILNNTIVPNVLVQTMEALNAIMAKFALLLQTTDKEKADSSLNSTHFTEMFVKSDVVNATIEAFKTLISKNPILNDTAADEMQLKINCTFCNIHSILTQYQQNSVEAYVSCNEDMLWCLKKVIQPIRKDTNVEDWDQYELEMIETLDDVLRVLNSPFDKNIVSYLISLWCMVDTAKRNNDDTECCIAIDYDELGQKLFNLLLHCVLKSNKSQLKETFNLLNGTDKHQLLTMLKLKNNSDNALKCYDKIKQALKE